MPNSKLSDQMLGRLRCPACGASLTVTSDHAVCSGAQCGTRFPVIDGVPILIDETKSIFSIEDFALRRDTTFHLQQSRSEALFDRVLGMLPELGTVIGSEQNYHRVHELLIAETPAPKVLVLGGSIQGQGMEPLANDRAIESVATDVSFGPLTALICDAHDIPFDDETFDAVIVQAVLEHVVDPHRCAEEIHRVLKHRGLVYAETPFMQQVHMGRYDFSRFTHSGHRRLFRRFDEVASGPICGPGMALAWSYQYFVLSFTTSRALRGLIRAFTTLTSFFLKYADSYLIHRASSIDAASGFYFIGRKTGNVLSDRDLIKYYRGSLSN